MPSATDSLAACPHAVAAASADMQTLITQRFIFASRHPFRPSSRARTARSMKQSTKKARRSYTSASFSGKVLLASGDERRRGKIAGDVEYRGECVGNGI